MEAPGNGLLAETMRKKDNDTRHHSGQDYIRFDFYHNISVNYFLFYYFLFFLWHELKNALRDTLTRAALSGL